MRVLATQPHVVRHGGVRRQERVRQGIRFEERSRIDQRRERIARMLVGVGRHRRQRLELPDHPQPVVYRVPVVAMPAVDGDGQQLRQHEGIGKRREHLVARRIQPRHHAPELRNPLRRWHAVCEERCLQRRQERRAETLDLDPRQQTGEQTEIAVRRFDAGEHLFKAGLPRDGKRGFGNQPEDQPTGGDQLREHQHGERDRDGAAGDEHEPDAACESNRRRQSPCHERAGAADRRFGGQHGEVFAQVDVAAQLVHRLLASQDFTNGRPRAEPRGQRRLARFGPCRVQQLEERRAAEEIEIARVRMIADEVRAVAAGSGPPTVQAFESTEVDALGAAGALDPFQHARVDDGQRGERAARGDRPPRRQRRADEREPECERQQRGQQQPAVRQPQVAAIERGQAFAPGRQAALVLSAGRREGVGQS